jgi:hypothetical protein
VLVSSNYYATIMQPLCNDYATIRQLANHLGTMSVVILCCAGVMRVPIPGESAILSTEVPILWEFASSKRWIGEVVGYGKAYHSITPLLGCGLKSRLEAGEQGVDRSRGARARGGHR